VQIELADHARLEWLPLEAIAHSGCRAHNRLSATLAPGAEMLGWDVTALGLPASRQPFDAGHFVQRIELPGLWLEQARIDANDSRLLDSPLGLGGRRCLGSLWLASGSAFNRERREHLLAVVRDVLQSPGREVDAGATCAHPQVLVVRAVAPVVEPLMALFQQVWGALRQTAWNLDAVPPRIWRV
jgi:urease accessory protein